MDLLKQPMFIREALAVHEAFRRLGFKPEDIFVAPGEGPNDLMKIALAMKFSPKDFFIVDIETSPQGMTRDELMSMWPSIIEAWNAAPEEVLQKIWDESDVSGNGFALMMALQRKGVKLPKYPGLTKPR